MRSVLAVYTLSCAPGEVRLTALRFSNSIISHIRAPTPIFAVYGTFLVLASTRTTVRRNLNKVCTRKMYQILRYVKNNDLLVACRQWTFFFPMIDINYIKQFKRLTKSRRGYPLAIAVGLIVLQ